MSLQQNATRHGRFVGWILFVGMLLVLSFAAAPGHTAFSTAADRILVGVRLSLVIALSVLVVHERLTPGTRVSGHLLQRCRRWFYDE